MFSENASKEVAYQEGWVVNKDSIFYLGLCVLLKTLSGPRLVPVRLASQDRAVDSCTVACCAPGASHPLW